MAIRRIVRFLLKSICRSDESIRSSKAQFDFIIELQAVGDYSFNLPLYKDVQSMLENGWTVRLYSFDHVNPEAFAPDNPVKSNIQFYSLLFSLIILHDIEIVPF